MATYRHVVRLRIGRLRGTDMDVFVCEEMSQLQKERDVIMHKN